MQACSLPIRVLFRQLTAGHLARLFSIRSRACDGWIAAKWVASADYIAPSFLILSRASSDVAFANGRTLSPHEGSRLPLAPVRVPLTLFDLNNLPTSPTNQKRAISPCHSLRFETFFSIFSL